MSREAGGRSGRTMRPGVPLTVAWIFLVAGGIVAVLTALWLIAPFGLQGQEPLGLRASVALFAATWGALLVATGLKVRSGRPWARWVGLALAVLTVIGSLQDLAGGPPLAAVRGALFGALAAYVGAVLAMSGDHFDHTRPDRDR